MIEGLFFAMLAAAGFGLFLRLAPTADRFIAGALAVMLGAFAWALVAIVLLIVLVPPAWAVPVLMVAAIGLDPRGWWRREGRTGDGKAFIAVLAVVAAVAWLAVATGWVMLSFDSVEQTALGRYLAQYGWRGEAGTLLASWGSLVPLVQGAGVGLQVDLVRSFQALVGVSLLAVCGWGTWRLAGRAKTLATLAVVASLTGCYFVLQQSQYIHNSLPSAVFLAGAVLLFAVGRERDDAMLLRPAFACLAAFCFCRTESPIFAALALVLGASLATPGVFAAAYVRLATIFAGAIVAWHLVLMAVIGPGTEVMTRGRLAMLVAILLAAAAAARLLQRPELARVRRIFPELLVVLALVVLAGAAAWRPDHMRANVEAVFGNLAVHGRWGMGWLAVAAALPFALRRTRATRHMVAFAVGFFALVLLLGMVRMPYRLGWGDSANRILTHLWPLLVVAVAVSAASFQPASAARSLPRTAGLAIAAGALAGVLAAALALWPHDVAGQAKVRQAEGFCPADNVGRYDFDVALAPESPIGYAAACSTGARSVVLEFAEAKRLHRMQLFEYAPEQAWQDFSVATSTDGSTWLTHYDTRDPQLRTAARRLSPTEVRVKLGGGPARFVRIDFRSSAGQNRLLLRRAALY